MRWMSYAVPGVSGRPASCAAAASSSGSAVGVGLLGGMGLAMSIFIAGVGYVAKPGALVSAKSALLFASLVAGICGYLWLWIQGQSQSPR